jgi:hypothetical protein
MLSPSGHCLRGCGWTGGFFQDAVLHDVIDELLSAVPLRSLQADGWSSFLNFGDEGH